MRKPRHLLRNGWKDSRAEISQILKEQHIDETRLRQLSINEDWKAIEEKIYHEFCQLDHPTLRWVYLWESFKKDTHSVMIKKPFRYLDSLVDSDEKVWFFVVGDGTKFWFYEGFIKEIVQVIGETTYAIDELYIASKKYEWLICINHHDLLIATGKYMPERLKKITEQ